MLEKSFLGGSENRIQLIAHPQYEMRSADRFAGRFENDGLEVRDRLQPLLLGNESQILHFAEHLVAAPAYIKRCCSGADRRTEKTDRQLLVRNIGSLGDATCKNAVEHKRRNGCTHVRPVRTEVRRALWETRKRCSLPRCELCCRNAKETLCRLLHAKDAGAKGNPVEVELEQLVFGIEAFELAPEQKLLELPSDNGIALEIEGIACQLPRDRRSSSRTPEADSGARNGLNVDASALIIALVFDRHECMLHIHRDLLACNIRAVLLCKEPVELDSFVISDHRTFGGGRKQELRIGNIRQSEIENGEVAADKEHGNHGALENKNFITTDGMLFLPESRNPCKQPLHLHAYGVRYGRRLPGKTADCGGVSSPRGRPHPPRFKTGRDHETGILRSEPLSCNVPTGGFSGILERCSRP